MQTENVKLTYVEMQCMIEAALQVSLQTILDHCIEEMIHKKHQFT